MLSELRDGDRLFGVELTLALNDVADDWASREQFCVSYDSASSGSKPPLDPYRNRGYFRLSPASDDWPIRPQTTRTFGKRRFNHFGVDTLPLGRTVKSVVFRRAHLVFNLAGQNHFNCRRRATGRPRPSNSFKSAGARVIVARTLADGLRLAAEPSAAVLDHGLNDTDGNVL
jgi:hypothetical protein